MAPAVSFFTGGLLQYGVIHMIDALLSMHCCDAGDAIHCCDAGDAIHLHLMMMTMTIPTKMFFSRYL